MDEKKENYGLDPHCSEILDTYRARRSTFQTLKDVVLKEITTCLKQNGMQVTAIEGRVKAEDSLAGKLALKGYKYASLDDIIDILGTRVITLYDDDVDKIAALIENLFDIDWKNSVDKRKLHQLDSFGYSSLHYICKVPKTLYSDAEHPELNTFSFEIQIRTTLQHVWSAIEHDIGYKSGFDIPDEYLRTLNILAGMLEMIDTEFSRIRTSLNDYSRKIFGLVASGRLDEVPLDENAFRQYLELRPFDKLNQRIAAINQAEIVEVSLMSYFPVLKNMGMKTLGDIESMKKDCAGDAYELARHHIGNTDLDIVTSIVGIQNLCMVSILRQGKGKAGLVEFLDATRGISDNNMEEAEHIAKLVDGLSSL